MKNIKRLVLVPIIFSFLLCSCSKKQETIDPDGGKDNPTPVEPEVPEKHLIENIYPSDGGEISIANDEVTEFVKNYSFTSSQNYVTHKDHYQLKGLDISWDCQEDANYYLVELGLNSDLTEASIYLTNKEALHLDTLEPGLTYYWRINAYYATKIVKTKIFSFYSMPVPYSVYLESLSNLRDMGGWINDEGKRFKTGLVYRGGNPDGISSKDKQYMLNTLKIKTELDLRNADEGKRGTNYLGVENYQVADDYGGFYYDTTPNGISRASGQQVLAKEIKLFANKDNYPIYFHCAIGRDRTGSLAMVLFLLLGMNRTTIGIDYEMSMFSQIATNDFTTGVTSQDLLNNLFLIYNYIYSRYSGETMKERTETFLLDIGVTSEEIKAIRETLLEETK